MIWGCDSNKKMDGILAIIKADELHKEMKKKAENYRKLEELTYADYMNQVKRHASYPVISNLKIAHTASKWLIMLQNKIDRRKKYEEKEDFDTLNSQIRELTDEAADITKIMFMGRGREYGIEYTLKYKDVNFSIMVPVFENVDTEHFQYIYEGKIRLGLIEDYHDTQLCSSYYEEDIKEAFKKFLEEKKI